MGNRAGSPEETVAAIVPNRNGGEGLLDCLAAILASLPSEGEVWLADDASSDGSPEAVRAALPQVRILPLDGPSGAAAARNRGLGAAGSDQAVRPAEGGTLQPPAPPVRGSGRDIAASTSRVRSQGDGSYQDDRHRHQDDRRRQRLLCVDADVVCKPDCLPLLLAAMEAADVVFPTLLSPDGEVLNPRTAFARQRCLNSAVFGIRREALGRMDEWFDETIQVYGEDNDFFLRAHRLGLRFRHVPTAQAIHASRKASLVGEDHYYLTVRNAVYVWLKLRRLVAYWMPMDIWIVSFLASQLAGALCNRSLVHPSVRYTDGPRLRLVRLLVQALVWNARQLRHTLSRRRAFRAALEV